MEDFIADQRVGDWMVFQIITKALGADLFEGVDVYQSEGHHVMPPFHILSTIHRPRLYYKSMNHRLSRKSSLLFEGNLPTFSKIAILGPRRELFI